MFLAAKGRAECVSVSKPYGETRPLLLQEWKLHSPNLQIIQLTPHPLLSAASPKIETQVQKGTHQ